jgi:hypothetical protein
MAVFLFMAVGHEEFRIVGASQQISDFRILRCRFRDSDQLLAIAVN